MPDMRLSIYLAIAAGLCLTSTSHAIEDTPENRQAQVHRYLAAVPPRALVRDLADNISVNYPPQQRAVIRDLMTNYVNIDTITAAMERSLLKHFTAEELKAIADLYSSPAGQSAMKKYGAYMADAMPVIQAEITRALTEFKESQSTEDGARTHTSE